MKPVRRIPDAAQAELFLPRCCAKPKALMTHLAELARIPKQSFIRKLCTPTAPCPSAYSSIIGLFAGKWSCSDDRARGDLRAKVSQLREELVHKVDDGDDIARILDEKGASLLGSCSDGSALVELLKQLHSFPALALQD